MLLLHQQQQVAPILKSDEGGGHWHNESIELLVRSRYFTPASLSSLAWIVSEALLVSQKKARPRQRRIEFRIKPTYRPPKHIR